jgi:ferric-dicitrate binding protein FerR (iron transport regulator)
MSHDIHESDPADETRGHEAARALTAGPPAAPADPAFRARLGQAFASGALDPESAPGAPARSIHARRPGSRFDARLRLLTAAAAALAVVAAAWAFNPGPQWRVAALQQAHGNIVIDGEPVPADDFESVNDALLPGATIEWNGDGDLELVSRGQLALAIMPGTRMRLPAPPPRWFARASAGRVESGEIRLTSGTRFHGARLTIATQEASVLMTGTTLAVIEEPMGTCVCVLEGRVRVMAGTRDMGMVPGGQRQVVFADGRAPERAGMRPIERVKLGEMRAAMAPMLEKPRRD